MPILTDLHPRYVPDVGSAPGLDTDNVVTVKMFFFINVLIPPFGSVAVHTAARLKRPTLTPVVGEEVRFAWLDIFIAERTT